MKVLCPVDFSEVSLNAVEWVARFLNSLGGSEIKLVNFIYIKRRASMFMHLDSVFLDRAKEDMTELEKHLAIVAPRVKISSGIYSSNPKEGIISVSKEGFDLIVTGTTGLTALKDMTIGSVTAYLMQNNPIPVLTIPGEARFEGVSKIALAVDDELVHRLSSLSLLRDLCVDTDARLEVIHVTQPDESPFEYDPGIDIYFRDLNFEYKRIPLIDSLTESINNYCKQANVDALCMLHRKRNWFSSLTHRSTSKSELFRLEVPLLIMVDE